MGSNFYRNKSILVTGGNGFVGTNLVERLVEVNANVRVVSLRTDINTIEGVEYIEADLRNLQESLEVARNIDMVFHLAAFGFGFGANLNIQPKLLTNNVLINTNMLEAAHRQNVQHYLFTSSIAVYDKNLAILDDNIGISYKDEPHESEKYYAYAKRVGEIQCKAYHENYGMKVALVRLSNPYGPFDTFDIEKSHVVPAFILKAFSDSDEFVVKGTGEAVRNFIFVEDVVEGMLLALEKYAICDPLNLCSEHNISILELCKLVLQKSHQEHKRVVLDRNHPDGVTERLPKVEKIRNKINFAAKTSIEDGLAKTIDWWQKSVLEEQKSFN